MTINQRLDAIRERLTIARKQAGLSQKQLARLMGYGGFSSTISNLENGERGLKVEHLLQYSELCDVSEVWLLTGVNPNFDHQAFWDAVGPVSDAMREDMVSLANLLETLRQA